LPFSITIFRFGIILFPHSKPFAPSGTEPKAQINMAQYIGSRATLITKSQIRYEVSSYETDMPVGVPCGGVCQLNQIVFPREFCSLSTNKKALLA
jgi:hypothetical protein